MTDRWTGEQVFAARKRLGLTQQKLGEALGLTGRNKAQVVRDWEKGRRQISGPAQRLLELLVEQGV